MKNGWLSKQNWTIKSVSCCEENFSSFASSTNHRRNGYYINLNGVTNQKGKTSGNYSLLADNTDHKAISISSEFEAEWRISMYEESHGQIYNQIA